MVATRKCLFAALLIFSVCQANASSPTEIERGFQSMYNLDFQTAHQNFSAWERIHPEDPLGPVSQAAGFLFGEFARLGILESELFTNDKVLKRGQSRRRMPRSASSSTRQ